MTSNRFLIINAIDITNNDFWLLISDYRWWGNNYHEIRTWTKECLDNFSIEGMILKFKNEEDRTFFLMRWANV